MKRLRIDTEYVIKISFVLSGRKLGSESYRILCGDGPCRKSSTESSISSLNMTPKSSVAMPSESTPIISSVINKPSISMINRFQQNIINGDAEDDSLSEKIMVAKSSDEVKVLLEAKGQLMKAGQQRLVLLEFVASWCGLCTKVAPQVDVRYFNSIIDNC
jgi:hypothetical protein